MLFNSLEFAVFFPVVCALYFLLPHQWQTPFLLLASCGFYMAFIPAYILILFTTILVDYIAGIWIENSEGRRRTTLLWVSISVTCVILFVFKYFYFFTDTLAAISAAAHWPVWEPALKIILPIGLSFHTFQSLSYVIEVYRGHQKAERNFVTYSTYVMFFPQLVAGPIERPQNLLHQFRERHVLDFARAAGGLKLMAWGFFKKLVIADRLALYVNDVYGAPTHFNGLQLTLGTFFFAYQIYCDFSGYSDIARGSARILGFELMKNFNDPYASSSISEFWRRWHISLSTWFRDYFYIPLGGSRVSELKRYRNLLVTFAVSGLWHGAALTYLIWGGLNGVYLVVGAFTQKPRDRLYQILRIPPESWLRLIVRTASTFTLIGIAWIVFRARNVYESWYIFCHLWKDWDFQAISTPQFMLRQMPIAIGAIFALEVIQALARRRYSARFIALFHRAPAGVRWLGYATAVVGVLMLGVYRGNQFIYFQF